MAEKPAVVWLHFQECTCCSESFLRASHPIVLDVLLDVLSLNYTETLQAAAGFQAEKCLTDTIRDHKGKYIVLVEGAVPTGKDGVYCMIGLCVTGYPPTLSAHDVGIKDLLDLFYMLDGGREVTLYAISIDPIQQISLELSSGIKKAANEAVERILGELAPPAAPSSYHTAHSP
jgi:hypothetical protein